MLLRKLREERVGLKEAFTVSSSVSLHQELSSSEKQQHWLFVQMPIISYIYVYLTSGLLWRGSSLLAVQVGDNGAAHVTLTP